MHAPYKLYHYWRSSSSWRVRFALQYKNIPFECIPVNLLNGESESKAHLERNPAGTVPVLEIPSNSSPQFLTESLAIIQYLERTHPSHQSLLPTAPLAFAKVWAMAETINAGTQPIQNIPVFQFHSENKEEQQRWISHFITEGLSVYEALCKSLAGVYSFENELTLADICLAPQLYNAERYNVNLAQFPTLLRVYQEIKKHPAYHSSHPDRYKPEGF